MNNAKNFRSMILVEQFKNGDNDFLNKATRIEHVLELPIIIFLGSMRNLKLIKKRV